MQLTSIEILNLWGRDKITLKFDDRVTFLTGINGCGKSSLLNIIYDTLNQCDNDEPTSKNRFWSAEAQFVKDQQPIRIIKAIFPYTEEAKGFIDDVTKEPHGLHQFQRLKTLEQALKTKTNKQLINHIDHTSKNNSTIEIVTLDVTNASDQNEIENYINNRRLAFLFQEDRNNLHNIDNTNIDLSLNYWKSYKNSIDERFHYLRDALQIHESRVNKAVVDLMTTNPDLQQLKDSDPYMNSQKIKSVITLLNQYFIESKKELTRDENNKLTLKPLDSDEPISWHLLSRGEKTLIYLFFVVFLYQSKVEVFLLDEPEISLHPKWQLNLIKDLSELAPNNQFIVATHSPSLIQNGWLNHCLDIS